MEHLKMFNIVSDDEDPVAHGIMALPSGKFFRVRKVFEIVLGSFLTVWKVSRWSRKLMDGLDIFQMVQKISR